MLDNAIEQIEPIMIVHLGRNKLLENSKDSVEVSSSDGVSADSKVRLQQANQRRNVPTSLPQDRRHQKWQQHVVRIRHAGVLRTHIEQHA